MSGSERLDLRVSRDYALSRSRAAALIMAGAVTVDGQPGRKPGQPVKPEQTVTVETELPPVSRAGGKLAGALEAWPIDVQGVVAVDVGSSTGGFTELLLERGAATVYAVDVGTGQLAWKLRQDPRVVSMERTDIREVSSLPTQPTVAVMDVSFISLRQVLPATAALLPPDSPVIALFKPQFEVGKKEADRGRGVITDQAVVAQALSELQTWLAEHDWTLLGEIESPVTGTKGNRERLLYLKTPRA
jgi:23S rRNA (cytidine1920-2'-O)/16S rRNA (cytidine1409-2'-O)-methyltransferase